MEGKRNVGRKLMNERHKKIKEGRDNRKGGMETRRAKVNKQGMRMRKRRK